jgi:hypothetical protein
MKPKYLVAAKNTDGRVCVWAQGTDLDAVKKNVDARWPTHGGSGCGCYEGEVRGQDEVHVVNEDGSITPHVASKFAAVAAALAKAETTTDVLGALDGLDRILPRSRRHENDEDRDGREEAELRELAYRKDEGTLRQK